MKNKLSLKEIFQGRFLGLGITEIIPPDPGSKKEFAVINIRLINRVSDAPLRKSNPTIAIMAPQVLNRFTKMEASRRILILDDIFKKNIIFLILSGSLSIPGFLKKSIAVNNIPVAASEYDEHYLQSILKAIIREKLQNIIYLHGVLLEADGKGVLITGASGIGKTTAALNFAAEGYCWVADDVVVIKKNAKGNLLAGGHKKTRDYIHTEITGIISAASVFDINRIKRNTRLAAVVEAAKTDTKNVLLTKGKKEILGRELPCLHVNIPSAGYFDKNLLKKSLKLLFKDK